MLSQKLSPEIIKLDAGTGAGWIGSPKAKEALLYFHGTLSSPHASNLIPGKEGEVKTNGEAGSGYVNIASEFLFHMLGDLVTTAKKDGKDFSVLAVEYGLSFPFDSLSHILSADVECVVSQGLHQKPSIRSS